MARGVLGGRVTRGVSVGRHRWTLPRPVDRTSPRYDQSEWHAKGSRRGERILLTASGGHVDESAGCGLRQPSYNSCRDRHCPTCLGSAQGDWRAARPRYLFPMRVLSPLFRGKFLAGLRELRSRGEPAKWERADRFAAWLGRLYRRAWVVDAKPPFGGPEQVLKYLARYTHRVAISNRRILDVSDGQVTFSWKDYAAGDRLKRLQLSGGEFLRRFLQHVLPQGFVRIRHYGLLANRGRDGGHPSTASLSALPGARLDAGRLEAASFTASAGVHLMGLGHVMSLPSAAPFYQLAFPTRISASPPRAAHGAQYKLLHPSPRTSWRLFRPVAARGRARFILPAAAPLG